MNLLRCMLGPQLYGIYEGNNVRLYTPNRIEWVGDVIAGISTSVLSIAYYMSPLIIYNVYANPQSWLAWLNLKTGSKVIGSAALIVSSTNILRGIGRSWNKDYIQFMATLHNNEDFEALRKYDFDIRKILPVYKQTTTTKTTTITTTKHRNYVRYLLVYGFILDMWHYILSIVFGRRMIYPGSLSIVQYALRESIMNGRFYLINTKKGVRRKIQCKSGNHIDTIYVAQPERGLGNILIITCEGNAGFMELGTPHQVIGRGYSVLGWNHPGFEYSTGLPYPGQDHEAIEAVIQYAQEVLGYTIGNIILYGWSIGGYSAAFGATCYPGIRGLFLDATFDDLLPIALTHMPEFLHYSVNELIRKHFDLQPANYLQQYNGPVTIVRRSNDEMMSIDKNNICASNRGNNLLMKLLISRFPNIFDTEGTKQTVLKWLILSAGERDMMEHRLDINTAYDTVNEYYKTDVLEFPAKLGEELTQEQKNCVAVFLASQYMKHDNNTHNNPININLINTPKHIPHN